MSSEVVIRATNLSKSYRIYDRPFDRVRQMLSLDGRRHYREFQALKDVNFEIRKGETVGIIGRNGSGKSTLLQLICGILKPTSGSIFVNGRISALLELGAGFHPEFTGRENVYMQGAVMGIDREKMDARFDDIAAFADIGEYIERPVKTYSKGMFVRLAFAVGINLSPDIFIIDEALSVGDIGFQRKCFAKLDEIRAEGATVVLVSHDTATIINICNNALLIERGTLISEGSTKYVVNRYLSEGGTNFEGTRNQLEQGPNFDASLVSTSSTTYPISGAEIMSAYLCSPSGTKINLLCTGLDYFFAVDVLFKVSAKGVRFGMLFKTPSGVELGGLVSSPDGQGMSIIAGTVFQQRFRFRCNLSTGIYFINAGVVDLSGNYLHRVLDAVMFKVLPDNQGLRTGTVDFLPLADNTK